jgi:hypothetical protein
MNAGPFHLTIIKIADPATGIGYSIEAVIVKGDQYAVLRAVHVGLEVAKAHTDRALKSSRRILWRCVAIASMREGKDPGVFKKRVSIHGVL